MSKHKRKSSNATRSNGAPRSGTQSPEAPQSLSPKLIHRFYEPLVLLCALGKNRGDYESNSMPATASVAILSAKQTRRLFLSQLAYLCDHKRGGDTVTAIGVERTTGKATFHVAANSNPLPKIVPFVEAILSDLIKVYDDNSGKSLAVQRMTRRCIAFTKERIAKNNKMVWRDFQSCRESLQQKASEDAAILRLIRWLERFEPGRASHEAICKEAYDNRCGAEMAVLKKLVEKSRGDSNMRTSPCRFRSLRHHIGRLGSQMKAINIIVKCLHRVRYLLDDYKVHGLPSPAPSPPPLLREKTNLKSILVRMLPNQSEQLAGLQDALAEMDVKYDLQHEIEEIYNDENFKPRVHAEAQVLNFFALEGLNFEDSDKFVACSKPACYCCLLYFRHHPLNPVLPPTHKTIHRNWAPPNPVAGSNTQRDIMNLMIKDLRQEALHQIQERRPRRLWQPDSTTGITRSDMSEYVCSEAESLDGHSSSNERLGYFSSSSSCSAGDGIERPATTSPSESGQDISFSLTASSECFDSEDNRDNEAEDYEDHEDHEDHEDTDGGVSLGSLMIALDARTYPAQSDSEVDGSQSE